MHKILLVFALVSGLSGCIVYDRDVKVEKRYALAEATEQLTSTKDKGLGNVIMNLRQYTPDTIIRRFGKPDNIETAKDVQTLTYHTVGRMPRAAFWFFLPFKWTETDNSYKYGFEFKDNKFDAFYHEKLARKVTGFALIFPVFDTKFYLDQPSPVVSTDCDSDLKKITVPAPHLSDKRKTAVTCQKNKLFGVSVVHTDIFDSAHLSDRYTKFFRAIFLKYDADEFANALKRSEKAYRNSSLDDEDGRLTDIRFTESKFKNAMLDCKLFSKKAKDYGADNRGTDDYLTIHVIGALCTSPQRPNTILDFNNSNRYPPARDKTVDTMGELKQSLSSFSLP